MRIWIDLDNSPHVLLFAPVIRHLERKGIDCLITARDFSQTCGLAKQYGLEFTTIGRHSQSSLRARKIANTLHRAWQLRRFVRKHEVAVAVSHGSRASLLAAKSLGLPTLTLEDYEFSSIGLYRWFADRILVPEVIPEGSLLAQGLPLQKIVRYPGLKEEAYIYDFIPNAGVLQELGLDPRHVIVTMRPPATWAHYHDAQGEELFRSLLRRLDDEEEIQVVIPARTRRQEVELRERYGLSSAKFRVSSEAIDGLSLMWFSDAVFSGGGTMIREAALMGVKAYSIFGGRIGAADEYLVSQGRLTLLRDLSAIAKLEVSQTPRPAAPMGHSLAAYIADQVLGFAGFREARGSVALSATPASNSE